MTVHAKEDHTVKRTLREIEADLDERFFRVGRSCIVNLDAIRRVTKTDVFLADGTAIARLYLTHPGVTADGIMAKMGL